MTSLIRVLAEKSLVSLFNKIEAEHDTTVKSDLKGITSLFLPEMVKILI